MNCKEFEALLSAYADNEVSEIEKQQIRTHLDNCGVCKASYEFEIATKKIIASSKKQKAPAGLREKIITEITSTEKNKMNFAWAFFRNSPAFAAAASILFFIVIFLTVFYIYGNKNISPFINTALAYYESNGPEEITGSKDDIEKDFKKCFNRHIPVPDLKNTGFILLGATHLPDVSEKPCAALRYKDKNGDIFSHMIICCTDIPLNKLSDVKDRPEYHYTTKNGLNMLFWRCDTTKTTRCMASNCSIEKLIIIADDFRSDAAKCYKDENSKKD